jgi:hypothetical protein
LLLDLRQCRQQQRRQSGDDGDDDEQFNQRKTTTTSQSDPAETLLRTLEVPIGHFLWRI